MANFQDAQAGLFGAVQGFVQGMNDTENRRFRQMELDARMKSDEESRARQKALDTYNQEKDARDNKQKEFQLGAGIREKGFKLPQLQEGQNISDIDPANLEYDPKFVSMSKEKQGIKDDPFSADLRSKWLSDPTTKDTRIISSAYSKISSMGKNPSAAGDLSLIFSYMKMLDPGSTVREGEFANAQNAAGVPDRIRSLYERIRNGERLSPNQRADFINQAKIIYDSQIDQQKSLDNAFKNIAKRRNLRGEDIVLSDDMFNPGIMKEQGMMREGMMGDGVQNRYQPKNKQEESEIAELLALKAEKAKMSRMSNAAK